VIVNDWVVSIEVKKATPTAAIDIDIDDADAIHPMEEEDLLV